MGRYLRSFADYGDKIPIYQICSAFTWGSSAGSFCTAGLRSGKETAWLCSLIPYVEHRVSINGITDPLLASFLDTSSKRLHCTSPAAQDREKIDAENALLMAFVVMDNGKTLMNSLPGLSDIASLSKLSKIIKDGLLNPIQNDFPDVFKKDIQAAKDLISKLRNEKIYIQF